MSNASTIYYCGWVAMGLIVALYGSHLERHHHDWMKQHHFPPMGAVELLILVLLWPLVVGFLALDWVFDFSGTRGRK